MSEGKEWWRPYVDFVHEVATSEHSEGCFATDEDEEDCECFYAAAKDLVADHQSPDPRHAQAREQAIEAISARLHDE